MISASKKLLEEAAKTAHEVNRAYCLAHGDDSQAAWEDAPEWQRQSAIQGVNALAENPMLTPAAMHERWLEAKLLDGWMYGAEKDVVKKTHPCAVPYRQLPPHQRAKDYLFRASVLGTLGHPDANPAIDHIEKVREHLQGVVKECQEAQTESRLTVGAQDADPAVEARMDLAVDVLQRLGHVVSQISGGPARG